MGVTRAALGLLLAAGASAHAEAQVDWASGLVTAEGVGIADRHAPSPAVARGTSRRGAEEAAKRALAAKIATLPLAAGGTVGDRGRAALDTAFAIAAEPETDGAWRVTMAVPIEAVRLALAGPRSLAAGGDTAAPVLIVEGVKAKPAIGYLDGATLFVARLPAWAADAPRVRGTLANGALTVAGGTSATLYLVLQ